jgi:thiamine-phosphate pyrophosphorylase
LPPGLPPRPFVYPILDAAALGSRSAAEAVRALAAGGARLVQLRAKQLPDGALLDLAREATAAARSAGVTLVINDRADVARIVGAGGLHVGQDDLPPSACRRILGEEALIGVSTHDLGQFEAAAREPVDYVAIGPVFETRSKEQPDPVVGLELVRHARARSSRPLVAIGGIDPGNARAVVEAGADGVAVISAVMASGDFAEAVRALRRAVGERV